MKSSCAIFLSLNSYGGIYYFNINILLKGVTPMKTSRAVKMFILTMCMSIMLCFSAFAGNGASSLEDLQRQAQETTVDVENNSSQGTKKSDTSGKSAIGNISRAAAMDTESEQMREIGGVMNSFAAKVMQLIGYVISIGLGLITALDIVYIAIPPLRGILANGYVGTGDQGGANNGMGTNMMNGAASSYGTGYGGFNGGYNSGYGQHANNMQMGMAAGAQQNNQPSNGRMQFVTNAALNAVASASSGMNPFKVYFKQQAAVCILAPTMFVLAATGVLSKLGFMLGQAASRWLGNISF